MAPEHEDHIPLWQRFEVSFTSSAAYPDPAQDAALRVQFTAPGGREPQIDGFWDGGQSWRVRFAPDELGAWHYVTICSNPEDTGLHRQEGRFVCGPPAAGNRFAEHGPVSVADGGRHLAHADGTPFFWLGDTAWCGPLLSTADEWAHYLSERSRQRFNVVQWVATPFLAAPGGDILGQKAYRGHERIAVNPAFFQRLDERLDATNRAGLLGATVMLWAAEWSRPEINALNPGYALPEDQAILLGRYMRARWGAHAVAWILAGDGDYRGAKSARWRTIGRGVFGDGPHAPVLMHPCGMTLPGAEFRDESWLDVVGYQSGHGDDEATLRWIYAGPPAAEWLQAPARPFINLEPPYENHIAYQSRQRFDAQRVRRAIYWSLLSVPMAGVTYGGHGVWGWDDGSGPPANHESTGVPLPWQQALGMLGAEQMACIADLCDSIEWWRLRPAPNLVGNQPGDADAARHVAAARSAQGDLALVYTPVEQEIELRLDRLRPGVDAAWRNPRTGALHAAGTTAGGAGRFKPPGAGDWIFLLRK